MKKPIAILVALALAGLGSPASAAEKHHGMKARDAHGTVKAAGAESIVVAGKGADEWTFELDQETKIRRAGKTIVPADLHAGDPVQVRYVEHDGKLVAQRVVVKAAGTDKRMMNSCAAKKNPCAARNPCSPRNPCGVRK